MEWTVEVEGVGEIGLVNADSRETARQAAIKEFGQDGYRALGDLSDVIYGSDLFSVSE